MAVKQGYLHVSPMAGVSSPKVVRPAPSIPTTLQLLALLNAASDDLRPLLVLQAFAGRRRAEANRWAWLHLHLDAPSPYAELPCAVSPRPAADGSATCPRAPWHGSVRCLNGPRYRWA